MLLAAAGNESEGSDSLEETTTGLTVTITVIVVVIVVGGPVTVVTNSAACPSEGTADSELGRTVITRVIVPVII